MEAELLLSESRAFIKGLEEGSSARKSQGLRYVLTLA